MRSFTLSFFSIMFDIFVIAFSLFTKNENIFNWFIVGMITGMTIGSIAIDCMKFYIEKELNVKK